MIRQSIKNYFINLKHFFTPIGTLFLGVVLGLSILFPGIASIFSELIAGINALSSGVQIDVNNLIQTLYGLIEPLNWNDPSEALSTLTSAEWLEPALRDCLNALLGTDYTQFGDQIAELVAVASAKLTVIVILAFLCVLLGLFGGYFLTRFLIRRTIAKRAWWKFILASLFESTVFVALNSLCLWLYTVWKPGAAIITVCSLLLFSLLNLLEAYIIHGWKQIRLKKILNIRNAVGYLLSVGTVLLVALTMVGVATALTNTLTGTIIGLSLLEIALLVISMNAEAYVKDTVEKMKAEKPASPK